MSLVLNTARTSLRAAKAPTVQFSRRAYHFENTADTARFCPSYRSAFSSRVLPFPTGARHRVGLALGVSAFFATGFGVPLYVCWYQQNK
ncbi:hypothetical protein MSPP1_001307 [Malassezia sp. CBS 17886]|nr:hypothetical protein MSPP1_001307 [Malassezia sp. CBS 17886]